MFKKYKKSIGIVLGSLVTMKMFFGTEPAARVLDSIERVQLQLKGYFAPELLPSECARSTHFKVKFI